MTRPRPSGCSPRPASPAANRIRLAAAASSLALLLVAGCATATPRAAAPATASPADPTTHARAVQTLIHSHPPNSRAVHRATLTIRQRQYVCDGVLRLTPDDGARLIVISPLGLVADIQARPDQPIEIRRPSPLFPPDWTQAYLGRDLRCLFQPPARFGRAVRLIDGRVALETAAATGGLRARYLFNPSGDRWEGLQLLEGSRAVYEASLSSHRTFAGWPHAVPTRIQINARQYHLDLRVADLHVLTGSP